MPSVHLVRYRLKIREGTIYSSCV